MVATVVGMDRRMEEWLCRRRGDTIVRHVCVCLWEEGGLVFLE